MSKEDKHSVIIIPGLGDEKSGSGVVMRSATAHWEKYGLHVVVHSVLWRNGEEFEPKLLRLLQLVDDLAREGNVSLVGASAGASMAFNAFSERRNVVKKAVNVCGRLRAGHHRVRCLDRMARTSIAFKQSVLSFENSESSLSPEDRMRLMTIRPFFGDELVPRDTAYLEGATNNWIYTPEHVLSIVLSLRFANSIISFLRDQDYPPIT